MGSDDGEEKREAIRARYIPLMAPLFFPDDPVGPDIVRYFASLLRIVGMEDKGWDPYEESRAMLDDINALMQSNLDENKFRDKDLTKGLLRNNLVTFLGASVSALWCSSIPHESHEETC